MRKRWWFFIVVLIALSAGIYAGFKLLYYLPPPASQDFAGRGELIFLPGPVYKSDVSLEEALKKRRSVRDYANQPVTLQELGQLLWAAQGITDEERGLRTAPSSFALYPVKVYVMAENVEGLSPGFYGYFPERHALTALDAHNYKNQIFLAVKQPAIRRGAVLLVIAGRYEEMKEKMGKGEDKEKLAEFCVHAEAGHIAQNIYLQAVSLGLGTVSIGGFDDAEVKKILSLDENEDIFYIMPVGRLKE
ncbi:SagB-type dehydrogenase domain-containing protein [Thermosyntropha lipolytica DSM 11003]|uniref:SagB-type dehydrogenase domain-containing protein n=1 Tax=Thermosyntropha lipolytica DSM 11003 TaxID=1123382 RepID=A0A1M5LYY6_9FIRM|nr:SagB/ThcOx family dehydrogenase [Thermosyntropha lipolytica]SHG69603.1 SagB-type dehydrogenase domain-containing protein [Thermosyntropha lipolytica DSM 11003]